MSLASDYAALCSTASAEVASVTASAPAPFMGPSGGAYVTQNGTMKITQTVSGDLEITGEQALAFAAWVTATFG